MHTPLTPEQKKRKYMKKKKKSYRCQILIGKYKQKCFIELGQSQMHVYVANIFGSCRQQHFHQWNAQCLPVQIYFYQTTFSIFEQYNIASDCSNECHQISNSHSAN